MLAVCVAAGAGLRCEGCVEGLQVERETRWEDTPLELAYASEGKEAEGTYFF